MLDYTIDVNTFVYMSVVYRYGMGVVYPGILDTGIVECIGGAWPEGLQSCRSYT